MRRAIDPVAVLVDDLQPLVAMADVIVGGDGVAQMIERLMSRTAFQEAAHAADALLQLFVFQIVDGAMHHSLAD